MTGSRCTGIWSLWSAAPYKMCFFCIGYVLSPAVYAATYVVTPIELVTHAEITADVELVDVDGNLTSLSASPTFPHGSLNGLWSHQSQQVSTFPVTVDLGAHQLDLEYKWEGIGSTVDLAGETQVFYMHSGALPRVELDVPAVSVVVDGAAPASPGECTFMSGDLAPTVNMTVSIPAGESSIFLRTEQSPELVQHSLSTFSNVTSAGVSLPIHTLIFEVCQEPKVISGRIEFQLMSHPTSILPVHNPNTYWFYHGLWDITYYCTIYPLCETLDAEEYTLLMSAEEIENSFEGDLAGVDSIIPSSLSPASRYFPDDDATTALAGWIEIDFSSLLEEAPMESFALRWDIEGITNLPDGNKISIPPQMARQSFPNPFAIVLGQLRLTYGGSANTSIRLPVYSGIVFEEDFEGVTDYQISVFGLDEFRFRVNLHKH